MGSANGVRSVGRHRQSQLLQHRERPALAQQDVGQSERVKRDRDIFLLADRSRPPKRGPNETPFPDCSAERNWKRASLPPPATPSREPPVQKQAPGESDAGHDLRSSFDCSLSAPQLDRRANFAMPDSSPWRDRSEVTAAM